MSALAQHPSPEAAPAPSGEAIVSAWLTDLRFDWSEVTRGYRRRTLAMEEVLFLEGQEARYAYVLEQGRMRLTSNAIDGKERHLMIVGPSGLLGDCGAPASLRHVMSAVAITEAQVCAVPMAEMLAALARSPALARQHQALTSLRFRIMLQHLALHGANSARRRVSHHLLGLLNSYGRPSPEGMRISIPFTQQEMGNICGLSRVSVSHVFTQLEGDGVIARAGRLIVVRELERLREMART
nr:Crp/Fnr family transcriptional regulator [uncultured Roseateles sp.]